jgi:hypothetical protein
VVPDITAIAAAINGLKTATDIVRYLRDTETAFKTADLKLRIAELTDALATAKLSLADVQDVLLAKDAEIKRLKESLKRKAEVIRHRDAYYEKNEKGQPVGDPYCSYCFENKNKLVHINQNPKNRGQSICPSCGNVFHWQRRQKPDA